MIVIYSRDDCAYCARAIRLAEKKNIKHTVYKIGTEKLSLHEFQEMFPNASTVPQIVNVDGDGNEYIGGYTEFDHWVLSKALGGITL
tara:strand:- start:1151 stop:1411 length:261 start_codon:yes stop_codon:yes gene_type:complete